MEKKRNPFMDFVRKALSFFEQERTKRTFNITYGVIWNLLLIFIIVAVLGASFAGGVGAGYFASLVKDEKVRSKEELQKDIYNYNETSEMYFADNVYMGKMRSDLERETITMDQIPAYLSNALIATEDEYFYKHDGVVPKAIFRAIFQDMTNSAVQSGGSTLTQQIIKNQILTNEVSFDRKAKEILLALRLEKFFDKKEILTAYLNLSTFGRNSNGRNIAGVQSAAKGIFGKDVKSLNLPQAAFIAGLPQSPFGYTPYTQDGTLKHNLEPGLNRMKTVLSRMHREEFINKKEYEDALKYDIKKDFIKPQPELLEKYPWLTYEVEKRSIKILAEYLAKKDGISDKDYQKDEKIQEKYHTLADRNIRQGGYRIDTTINKKILDKMEAAKSKYPYYGPDKLQTVTDPETKKKKTVVEPVQAGAVLIENTSGKILSFIGGRDYKIEQTNHATSTLRSNGSTMKPLLVYGPGIELGALSPGSLVADMPISVPAGSKRYEPQNYGESFHGITTARKALANSYNVPAVKFYLDIKSQNPVSYLEKMGFSSLAKEDYSTTSIALGGLTNGVSVEEDVNAYTTFANGGQFIDAYMIEKITDETGKTIYQHKNKPVKVFSPQTAYLTLDMMRDVVRSGTAASVRNRLQFSSDWAGKTGTSQYYRDAWFVASNPKVTFGTWMGYDTPKPLVQRYQGLTYSQRNLYLWADLMNAAYKADSAKVATSKRFEMPGGIVSRSSCEVTGIPAGMCKGLNVPGSDLANINYSASKVTDRNDIIARLGSRYMKDPGALFSGRDGSDKDKAVNLTLNGMTLSWSKSSNPEIAGYRVYRNGSLAGTVSAGSSRTYSVTGGTYTVKAVDKSGNVLSTSNSVTAQSDPKRTKQQPAKNQSSPEQKSEETKPSGQDSSKQEPAKEDTSKETGTTEKKPVAN
nr:transglycosylase domain-containing protein [Peribacillus kribbensis]